MRIDHDILEEIVQQLVEDQQGTQLKDGRRQIDPESSVTWFETRGVDAVAIAEMVMEYAEACVRDVKEEEELDPVAMIGQQMIMGLQVGWMMHVRTLESRWQS